jgi:hypothetical protein
MFFLTLSMFAIGAVTAFTAARRGSLLLFFFQVAFSSLVSAQALWFSLQDEMTGGASVGYARFSSIDAMNLVIFFLAFQIGLFFVSRRMPVLAQAQALDKVSRANETRPVYNVSPGRETAIHLGVALVIGAAMINNAGGIIEFLYSPGAMIPGQTFLILALSVLKWSLFNRIMKGMNITLESILFFLFFLIFSLFTSRFMTIFAILQLLFFVHYYRQQVSVKSITFILIIIFTVVVIYGVYRDLASRGVFTYASFDQIIEEIFNFQPVFLDWFFSSNIEIFIGSADALRQLREGLHFDFLVSELSVIFSFFPNAIRTDEYFGISALVDGLELATNRSSSVVPSGFERYLLGLGVFGLIGYGVTLLWFLSIAERALRNRETGFVSVVSVQAINGLRGSLIGALAFFGFAEFLASKVFRLYATRVR